MENDAGSDGTEKLEGQQCPICGQNTLTLMETQKEIEGFGTVLLFSMECSSCDYYKADVEPAEEQKPSRYTLEISSEEDLQVRVVKSSTATVKVPNITSLEPGPASNGYITNVEGLLNRIKHQIQKERDDEEDKEKRTKTKRMMKKISRVMGGLDSVKLTVEDPNGNSAIVSEKATIKKI